jgi:hypothetical protein
MSKKYALIIGNSEYQDLGLSQLPTPSQDAQGLAEVLRDPDIGAFDGVNIVLDQTADKIMEAIDDFFDQRKADDLPAGTAGITTQMVAVQNDLIYEVLVEPQQLTGNQVEPFQTGEVKASNREWIDRIIATFKFSD